MLLAKIIAIAALGATLSGCMSDGIGLDASLGNSLGTLGGGGGLGLGGNTAAASLPSTDAYVKQQLERRGI